MPLTGRRRSPRSVRFLSPWFGSEEKKEETLLGSRELSKGVLFGPRRYGGGRAGTSLSGLYGLSLAASGLPPSPASAPVRGKTPRSDNTPVIFSWLAQ